ncbi:MAG: hypothetical protein PHR00_01475 [Patescibacteria group bacterium]|nr:hypothetical protein [Patescibacteria group bacterium]
MSPKLSSSIFKLEWYWHAIFSIFIVGLSLTISFFSGINIDTQERRELSLLGKIISMTVSEEMIANLKGTSDDFNNPDYNIIKEKFTAIGDINEHVRYIYIFGRKNGELFFYLDSEPHRFSSQGMTTSNPGEIYNDNTGSVENVFKTGKAATVGPETDEWGTFISSLIPIIDSETGKTIAVVGVDVDINEWLVDINFRNILSISIGFVIILIYFIIVYINKKIERKILRQNKDKLISQ